MNARHARLAAAVLAAVVVVAACGSTDTPTETSGPPSTATDTATAVVPPSPAATATAGPTPTTEPTSTSTPAPTASPSGTPTPAPTTTPAEQPALAAPWASAALSQTAVSPLAVTAWNESDQSGPALYPGFVETRHPDAAARRADFSGGWGLAWDRPGGPGRSADGSYCGDCGRSAFGVAGTRSDTVLDNLEGPPLGTMLWSDGSRAAWFYEGFVAAETGAPLLAYIEIPAYPVLYQAWSFLGEEDLLNLISELRYVEGLGVSGGVEAAGPAPWGGQPLRFADVATVYAQEWIEAGSPTDCPCLALASLGPEGSDAVIRRAENVSESLIAWDRPSGPGHDAQGDPCQDCGRGAIGLGTFQGADLPGPPTMEWEDGSIARVTSGLYGTEAWIAPAGGNCIYWLWSHLGTDHLRYLLTQLRRVE